MPGLKAIIFLKIGWVIVLIVITYKRLSRYTQSRSSLNRLYDSKARRYAEDNKTESNGTHW